MSPTQAREAFRELSNAQKANVWLTKLDELINSQMLNQHQKDKIKDLMPYIKPNVYMKNSKERQIFDDKLKEWLVDYKDFFTKTEVKNHLAEITPPDTTLPLTDDCSCNVTDDWCTFQDKCESTDCEEFEGCGFIWSRRCNGTCE